MQSQRSLKVNVFKISQNIKISVWISRLWTAWYHIYHTDIRWYEISIKQGGSQVWQISRPQPHPVSRDCPCQISRKMLWWSASTTHASNMKSFTEATPLLAKKTTSCMNRSSNIFSTDSCCLHISVFCRVFVFLYSFATYWTRIAQVSTSIPILARAPVSGGTHL